MGRYLGRKKGIALIPTLLTLGNGFCGFVAIAKAMDAVLLSSGNLFEEKITQAAWFIFLAMVFDALDGRVARLTHQTTEFGAQLDSFTDLISFGIAPAVIVKVIYEQSLIQAGQVTYSVKLTLMLTALYAVCAVLRLARYTVETSEDEPAHNIFVGLPTPAAAGVIASGVIFLFQGGETFAFMANEKWILAMKKTMIYLPPLLGLLMISKIEYVHFFNRFVRGRKTFNFLVQGVLCIFIIAFWHTWALLLCFTLYLLSGPVLAVPNALRSLFRKDKRGEQGPS
jgi:CDP-diacylglycerol--serine O-phosphatidyltransferase